MVTVFNRLTGEKILEIETLKGADLSGVNLSGADLSGTKF